MEIKTYSAVMPLSAMTVEPTPSKQGIVWLNPLQNKNELPLFCDCCWLKIEEKVNNHTVLHTLR